MAVDSYITNLSKTDAAKGEALGKDLKDLRGLTSKPEALKAKAKEMVDKL